MSDFFFISYSSVDGASFVMKLSDELAARPTMPPFQTTKYPTERLPREVPANYPTWRRET